MEYEGLLAIYFDCGCYSHLQDQCPITAGVATEERGGVTEETNRRVMPSRVPEEKFRPWM